MEREEGRKKKEEGRVRKAQKLQSSLLGRSHCFSVANLFWVINFSHATKVMVCRFEIGLRNIPPESVLEFDELVTLCHHVVTRLPPPRNYATTIFVRICGHHIIKWNTSWELKNTHSWGRTNETSSRGFKNASSLMRGATDWYPISSSREMMITWWSVGLEKVMLWKIYHECT